MLKKSIPVLLALWVSVATAQGLDSLAKLREATDGIMSKVGSGDFEGGLRAIKPLSIVPEVEMDAAIG